MLICWKGCYIWNYLIFQPKYVEQGQSIVNPLSADFHRRKKKKIFMVWKIKLASPGLEPETFSVLDWRDNQLHHDTRCSQMAIFIIIFVLVPFLSLFPISFLALKNCTRFPTKLIHRKNSTTFSKKGKNELVLIIFPLYD